MFQMNFRHLNDKDTIRDSLEKMIGRSVSLNITDNVANLLSIRTKQDVVSVRMHWMFLKAGDDIIAEIAAFIRKRRGWTPLIRKFIRENRDCIRAGDSRPRLPAAIRTKGRFHDVGEMFSAINDKYFSRRIAASISWGKRNPQRAVKKRILGSYCRHSNTIRINPVLDRRTVPDFFIRYIVYHEMLHSDLEEGRKNGRRLLHGPAFRQRERLFEEHEKAASWEKRYFTGNAREAYSKK
jgi:predicted SprT family Zn-dependent metalloprotease